MNLPDQQSPPCPHFGGSSQCLASPAPYTAPSALSPPLEQFLGSFSILPHYWEALLPLGWCFKLCVSLSKPTRS